MTRTHIFPGEHACDACPNVASHTTYIGATTEYRCCRCHVLAGKPPADWHPLCMATYRELHPNPLAAELDAIAEEMRATGQRNANGDLEEYGALDYRGVAAALTAYADRIRAVAQQLKG